MKESNGVRWTNYEDVPKGDGPGDYFTQWKDLAAEVGTEQIGITYLHLAPGESGPMHAHENPIEEVYFVFDGRIDIETPDEAISVDKGTIVYFEPNTEHRPANNSNEPAEVLTFKNIEDGSIKFRETG